MGNGYRIFLMERDIYARQAIVGFLGWDRRTRVIGSSRDVDGMLQKAENDPSMQRLDVILLDVRFAPTPEAMQALLGMLRAKLPQVQVVCMGHVATQEHALIRAAYDAGASGYFIREKVGPGLASALRYALTATFCVTEDIRGVVFGAAVLPGRRSYPRLTRRIEQALQLCVVEGLPAELAADEMGVSTSTVRSYIKEGYRILEAHDDTIYPDDISPAERAFLRYTALNADEWPAA
jgi:DNA-binding NarL/FixJ family response regulator